MILLWENSKPKPVLNDCIVDEEIIKMKDKKTCGKTIETTYYSFGTQWKDVQTIRQIAPLNETISKQQILLQAAADKEYWVEN